MSDDKTTDDPVCTDCWGSGWCGQTERVCACQPSRSKPAEKRATCDQCRHWHRGYRLHGSKVPSFCNRHFHSQAGDDPACKDFGRIDTRSIEHPPYAHPGDVA